MRRVLLITGILVGVVLTLRLAGLLDSRQPTPGTKLATPSDSDYYMTDAVVRQMDQQGRLAYRLRVAETLHFPDDSARLTDIAGRYITGRDSYWDITAQHGRVPAHTHHLYLYGGLTGRRPNPDASVARITADHAWVYPDRQRIQTQARVVATQPGQRVTGRGMTLDLDTDRLTLLDDVHVSYTPAQ